MDIPTPAGGEYAPHFRDYVAIAAELGGGLLLAQQSPDLIRLCAGLDEEAALHRYAPGKWSVKEVIGHMVDVERVFSYRALRISRGDRTPLPGFDENSYVAAADFDRRATGELLAEFGAVREATRSLFAGFRSSEWDREGVVSGAPLSVRAIAFIAVGHVEHHIRILRDRYRMGP